VQSGNGNLTSFLAQRNQLVLDIRKALTAKLSSGGTKLLDAYVQVQKLSMKTTETQ
jgi:hypothetical protein